jgi:hypothetical protein
VRGETCSVKRAPGDCNRKRNVRPSTLRGGSVSSNQANERLPTNEARESVLSMLLRGDPRGFSAVCVHHGARYRSVRSRSCEKSIGKKTGNLPRTAASTVRLLSGRTRQLDVEGEDFSGRKAGERDLPGHAVSKFVNRRRGSRRNSYFDELVEQTPIRR